MPLLQRLDGVIGVMQRYAPPQPAPPLQLPDEAAIRARVQYERALRVKSPAAPPPSLTASLRSERGDLARRLHEMLPERRASQLDAYLAKPRPAGAPPRPDGDLMSAASALLVLLPSHVSHDLLRAAEAADDDVASALHRQPEIRSACRAALDASRNELVRTLGDRRMVALGLAERLEKVTVQLAQRIRSPLGVESKLPLAENALARAQLLATMVPPLPDAAAPSAAPLLSNPVDWIAIASALQPRCARLRLLERLRGVNGANALVAAIDGAKEEEDSELEERLLELVEAVARLHSIAGVAPLIKAIAAAAASDDDASRATLQRLLALVEAVARLDSISGTAPLIKAIAAAAASDDDASRATLQRLLALVPHVAASLTRIAGVAPLIAALVAAAASDDAASRATLQRLLELVPLAPNPQLATFFSAAATLAPLFCNLPIDAQKHIVKVLQAAAIAGAEGASSAINAVRCAVEACDAAACMRLHIPNAAAPSLDLHAPAGGGGGGGRGGAQITCAWNAVEDAAIRRLDQGPVAPAADRASRKRPAMEP
mmetsp:Transcript_6426/g.21473  ORF Transcript_6426/g.21473 Transcript_6426/m.21473 type:complete len:547 (-) Transcript_6426:286-1926(-)